MAKHTKEEWKTYGNVFDDFTNRNIKYLENQGHFDELAVSLEVGKEANVFLGKTATGSNVIIKIYRLENCNFNKMFLYLKGDPRFPSIKPNRREIIFAWTLREYRNLLVARQVGCSVPTPIANKHNILLEEFIGTDKPAPKIKDVAFKSDAELTKCLKAIMKEVKLLWKKAEIVHGDLSEFNILYHNKKPVLIDFSQSTSVKDFHAREYLERDLKNLVRFFNKRGLNIEIEDLLKGF